MADFDQMAREMVAGVLKDFPGHISVSLGQLRLERDISAALRRTAERMRERCAVATEDKRSQGGLMWRDACRECASTIRALPVEETQEETTNG